MNHISFFGTQAFPNQFLSNKNFNKTIQIALLMVVPLGIVLASLGAAGILHYNFVAIGSTIAVLAFVTLIAYRCLQKNWLLEALQKAMRDNDPDSFQAVIDQCVIFSETHWWDLCDANGPITKINSRELVGTLQDTEISDPINEFIWRNLNTIQNADRWDEVFNNLMNECDVYAPEIHTFESQRNARTISEARNN